MVIETIKRIPPPSKRAFVHIEQFFKKARFGMYATLHAKAYNRTRTAAATKRMLVIGAPAIYLLLTLLLTKKRAGKHVDSPRIRVRRCRADSIKTRVAEY